MLMQADHDHIEKDTHIMTIAITVSLVVGEHHNIYLE